MQHLYNLYFNEYIKEYHIHQDSLYFPLSYVSYTLNNYIMFAYVKLIDKKCIPEKITHATCNINQEVEKDFIPDTVKYLFLDNFFNQPLDKFIIPDSVTHLYLGDYFNQSIENLPKSLKYLRLGKQFNQDLKCLNSYRNLKILCLDSDNNLNVQLNNQIIIKSNHSTQASYFFKFCDFIENSSKKYIYEDLCKAVFMPKRIHKICDTYDIEFQEYCEILM